MINRNLIYNKPTSKGSSYFITNQPIVKKIYDEESPQITIPETQENEIFISSPQFPTSDDPIKIDDKQVKQDDFISLRKEFEEFKVSVSKNFEKVKYMEQLYEDNKNKNLIIKILLENITSLTDTIKKYSQPIKKDNTNENNKNPHDNILESLNVAGSIDLQSMNVKRNEQDVDFMMNTSSSSLSVSNDYTLDESFGQCDQRNITLEFHNLKKTIFKNWN